MPQIPQGKPGRTAAWAALGLLGYLAAREAIHRVRHLDLGGKNVLITGGSRGLGLLLAREFASAGSRVAICARDTDELNRATAELSSKASDFFPVACDITDREQVTRMISEVQARLGPIDVLVNNAGTIVGGPYENQSIEDFEQVMRVNFWGAVYAVNAVLPSMKQRRSGRIVNISSIGGKLPVPHLLTYCASKFALLGFSEALRTELARHNIWVTTICPGLMRTGSARNALFTGQHRKEYAWFILSDSLPGTSINAQRAARRIVRACVNGEGEVTVGLPAITAAKLYALFPNLTLGMLTTMNSMLPDPVEHQFVPPRKGYESETRVSRSRLTGLTREAERANNQL